MSETNRQLHQLKIICIGCEEISPPPYKGNAVCGANGKSINENARNAFCPMGYYPPNAKPQPTTPIAWPKWATSISHLRAKADKGVGDTIHRLLLNGWIESMLKELGVPCGCSASHQLWNQLYPYREGGTGYAGKVLALCLLPLQQLARVSKMVVGKLSTLRGRGGTRPTRGHGGTS